jgi:hypothetical protein
LTQKDKKLSLKPLVLFIVSITFIVCSHANTDNFVIDSAVISISNNFITINPVFDNPNANDPGIKAIINYVKHNGKGVLLVLANPNNLRFAKQVNQMFNDNGIPTAAPQLAKNYNELDFNLIKIYVVKQNKKIASNPALSIINTESDAVLHALESGE